MCSDQSSMNSPDSPDQISPLGRAVCRFSGGQSLRLYLSDLTQYGAFILAMKLPTIGDRLTVTVYPAGSPPLPPIDAKVIGVRIDPADASRTGFEVVFSSLDEILCSRLAEAVDSIERWKPAQQKTKARTVSERRTYPRVKIDMQAYVKLPDGSSIGLKVLNISMSGAMLLFGDKPRPTSMSEGETIEVDFLSSEPPEHIEVKAKVARLSHLNELRGAGIHFIDLDESVARRIEGLILDALTGQRSWFKAEQG
jgi:hypothetical protein